MKVSNYLLSIIIIVLGITLVAQNKVIVDLRNEYETGLNGGDISKAQTIDSLQHLVDSLYNENFVCQIDKGRYEVALEILKEEDKKAFDKFELILTTQTE